MAGLEARGVVAGARRADAVRGRVADGLRGAGGLRVSVEGDEVVAEGRGLRLRALTDPTLREVLR